MQNWESSYESNGACFRRRSTLHHLRTLQARTQHPPLHAKAVLWLAARLNGVSLPPPPPPPPPHTHTTTATTAVLLVAGSLAMHRFMRIQAPVAPQPAQLPPGAELHESWWTWEGSNIHYLQSGDADPPLLCVHGVLADLFRRLLPRLGVGECRVHAIDLLGMNSPPSPTRAQCHALPPVRGAQAHCACGMDSPRNRSGSGSLAEECCELNLWGQKLGLSLLANCAFCNQGAADERRSNSKKLSRGHVGWINLC